MKRNVFIGLIGFCFGVYIAEYRTIGVYAAILFLCVTLGYLYVQHCIPKFRTKYGRIFLILVFAVSLGIVRTEYSYRQLPEDIFIGILETKQELRVKIVSPIDVRHDSTRFIAEPIHDTSLHTAVPYIRVTLPRVSDVAYGDVLVLEGVLTSVMTNNKTYARAQEGLVRKGVMYELRLPHIINIEHGKGNYFYVKLYKFGDTIKGIINTYIREPSAGFVNGTLLGEKYGLSKEWYDKFTSIGLTHVIVLSGYNLAIIFAWTRVALRKAPFVVQHVVGACAVILLMLVSGADAPAVRAAILVLTASLAALLHRQEDAGYFLSLTVLCMLLWNPFYLLYDISFQLSVAATYGLTYLAPALEKYIFSTPKFGAELVRDTMSAQVAVLPLQLLYFGTVSWISLFANIVILPLIPMLMILGVLVLATSFIPFVALGIGTITTLMSDAVLDLVTFFSSHTKTFTISISLTTFFLLYMLIIIFVLRVRKKYEKNISCS